MKPLGTSITHELVSATSALNTHVTYSGPHQTVDDELVWIPDAEPLVAHSIEHIYAAIDIASKELHKDISKLKSTVYRILKDNLLEEEWLKIDNAINTIQSKL